jgi:hypothetical protein
MLGDKLGLLDGAFDALEIGLLEGEFVGVLLGDEVGDVLGEAVEPLEGDGVGLKLGEVLGERLGAAEGLDVGKTVGLGVMCFVVVVVADVATVVVVVLVIAVLVGDAEGLDEGDLLGDVEGLEDGTPVVLWHDAVNSSCMTCLLHVLPKTLVARMLLASSYSFSSALDILHKQGSDNSEVQCLLRIRML